MFFDNFFNNVTPQQLIDMQNFKKFLLDNTIISTTVGVLIAYSALDFIKSLVGDLLLPGIYFLIIYPFVKNNSGSNMFEPMEKLNIPKFITELLSFILIVIVTYLSIQYVIKNWINIDNVSQKTPSPQVIQGNTVSQVVTQDTYNYKSMPVYTSLGSYST